jgi:hypothetical protein
MTGAAVMARMVVHGGRPVIVMSERGAHARGNCRDCLHRNRQR